MTAEPPTVPGYRLSRRLGGGAQGNVWLAVGDDALGREVALKLFRDASYARELEAWRALEGLRARDTRRRLVEGIAAGELPGGGAFIAMAFHPEGSLRQRLETSGPVPEPRVLRWGLQLAEGLALLHAHGVVHRDLKPSNVLLHPWGDACIADFGLTRAAASGAEAAGTPGFCAPEIFDAGSSGAAVDIYSCGATLHALLVGAPPSPGIADLIALERAEVSRGLQRVLVRCLAERPADRFASAEELLAALQRCAAEPEEAAPPRRGRGLLVAGLVVALALALWLARGNPAPTDPGGETTAVAQEVPEMPEAPETPAAPPLEPLRARLAQSYDRREDTDSLRAVLLAAPGAAAEDSLWLAVEERDAGEVDAALARVEAAGVGSATPLALLDLLAWAAARRGDLPRADSLAARMIAAAPGDVRGYARQLELADRRNEQIPARLWTTTVLCDQGWDRLTTTWPCWSVLFCCAVQLRELERALAIARQLQRRQPGHRIGFAAEALVHGAAHRPEDSARAWEEADRAAPWQELDAPAMPVVLALIPACTLAEAWEESFLLGCWLEEEEPDFLWGPLLQVEALQRLDRREEASAAFLRAAHTTRGWEQGLDPGLRARLEAARDGG